jgi:hypothetical protein
MKCNCIKELEKNILEQYNKKNKKEAVKATIKIGYVADGKKIFPLPYSIVELEFAGQEKKDKMNLLHSFCAFCGAKIDKPIMM